jgi:predicted ATPase
LQDGEPAHDATSRDGAGLGNVPVETKSFVGRTREFDDVDALLRNHRLISVGGPGGVGKTRFTTWLASRIGRRFSDGVWFVELGPLQDPDLVVPAIARVLGVPEPINESLPDTLISWLASKSALLLLDNCEHLIDACRAVVARIIAETHEVRIICTTRRWLDLQPEQRYGLAPLTPPECHGPPTLDDLNASPAAQLLLQRAGQVDGVSLATPAALQAVVDICRRLDGLPLALELAAARTDVLSFEQIADSLDVRLRLLKDRTQRPGARHSTLETMIRWSYDLLTDVQKTAFRRLGIFPGRFALDAARAVYGSSGAPQEPMELIDTIQELIAHSLVVTPAVTAGKLRYQMLESLRAFALERLREAAEEEPTATALTEFVEQFVSGPPAADQAAVEAEIDNLRFALRWTIEDAHAAEKGARLLVATTTYWQQSGRWIESDALYRKALLSETSDLTAAERACLLLAAGAIATYREDYTRSTGLFQEALELAKGTGDNALVSR